MSDERRQWYFYCTDDDRSWGWDNHVFSYGAAFRGFGDTADAALAEAVAARRDDFTRYEGAIEHFTDGSDQEHGFIAIPIDAEHSVLHTFKNPNRKD